MVLSPARLRIMGGILAALTLAVDQYSKMLILEAGRAGHLPLPLFPFFNIELVFNKGISFGMLATAHPGIAFLLPLVLLAIVAVLAVWLCKAREVPVAAALGFILGGAAGNLVDRARNGMVTDFLDLHVGIYHWPAFNLADSAIFIGVVLFIFTNIIGGETDISGK